MKTKSVYGQIEDIRRQLWLGHASLMVGCGFSRNADKATPTTPTPPDWNELGDKLIEALYPRLNKEERAEMRTTKNILQLANEFDVAFQRPALNALLKKCIQDDNLLPSELHENMLKLPWADVFTTNYDTLLERAARQVTNIKYDVVLNCKDLPYSESPRIIKLHGSFPSEATHLIISEEDYRTYPEEYSPFVNTVQQAIMETTLCLIGFSGADSNFRKWIGWVKDNLHNSMPPVYLIGLFDLSVSERRFLEERNIVPVDLSELPDIPEGNHVKALKVFYEMIREQPDYYNWPKEQKFKAISPENNKTKGELIEQITRRKLERESYPNWIVLPWEKRSSLKTYTEHWALNSLDYLKRLPPPWDIQGLYELDWRMEKCLMPIFNHFIKDYEIIIGKYDPFGLENPKKKNPDLQEKWLSLCFSVLRWSREEFEEETWRKYEGIIQQVLKDDIYLQNRFYYEQAFHAMTLPDMNQFETIMQKWNAIKHPLFWKVKIASVFYLMGEKSKAQNMWMEALVELRPHIPKSKIKDDFNLLSIEGSILANLFLTTTHVSEQALNEEISEQKQNYKARLQDLEQIGCSPLAELKKFALSLAGQKEDFITKRSSRDFDRHQETVTFYHCWSPLYVHVFQHLRFFEEAGMPFLPGDTMHFSLSFLSMYSPWWAFCLLNIIGSSQWATCEIVFSQEKIYCLSSDKNNSLVENYIRQLNHLITQKRKYLTITFNNYYAKLAKNLFEVISRLTIKAKPEKLQRIFDLGIELYKVNNDKIFFQRLGSRYFKRLFDAMSPQQIFNNLDKLLSIPISLHQKGNWESPALFVDWRGFTVSPHYMTTQLKSIIQHLTEELDTDNAYYRSEVLHYLNLCIDINLLSASCKKTIAKVLMKHLMPPNFPQITNNYFFAYKKYLDPLNKKREIDSAIKNYYFRTSKCVFDIKNGNITLPFSDETDFIKMSKSLLATCSVFNKKEWMYFDLTPEECKLLFNNIKNNLPSIDSINRKCDSQVLFQNDAKYMIKKTFQSIDMIFGAVIVPRIKDEKTLQSINGFVHDIERIYSFPVTAVAFMAKKGLYDDSYIVDTISKFNESDNMLFYSYAYSIYNVYRFSKQKELPTPPMQLFNALVSAVNMKSDITFCSACTILGYILSVYSPPETESNIILQALKNLLRTTSFSNQNERFTIQDRYDYRQSAAYLAACMFRLYQNEKREIPPELQAWYDLRESEDELPDIRNTWMDVLNNA